MRRRGVHPFEMAWLQPQSCLYNSWNIHKFLSCSSSVHAGGVDPLGATIDFSESEPRETSSSAQIYLSQRNLS